MLDTTNILAFSFHIIDFQRNTRLFRNKPLETSCILAHNFYANGIKDVDVKIGSIVGYFRDKTLQNLPIPIMVPSAWCEVNGKIIDSTYFNLSLENVTYFTDYKKACERFDFLMKTIVGKNMSTNFKREHISKLVKLQKTFRSNQYMLNPFDEYVKSYIDHCRVSDNLVEIKNVAS